MYFPPNAIPVSLFAGKKGVALNALSDAALQGRRLLILDDDELVGATIASAATRLGLEARAAAEPERFFQLLQSWQPTDILLDLVMPRLDGLEVIARLAESDRRPSLMLISGTGPRVLDAARRTAAAYGVTVAGVLAKPFTTQRLAALLLAAARPPEGAAPGEPAGGEPEVTVAELERALQRDEIRVYYQPKVACADGRLAGFEGLARWQHAELGLLSPRHFIALAEGCELIHPLTDRVLDLGLRWLATLPPGAGGSPSLSLNLSARCLEDAMLVERVLGACRRHAVAPERLVLEVTETSAMKEPIVTLEVLTRLRLKGVRLSLDDFGVGYSSLIELARLPFSELKIDKGFVAGIEGSEEARKIIAGIVSLAQSLGLQVTAEGVERPATLDFLREIGCDLAQGYLIGRPMPAGSVPAWLAARGRAAPGS